MLLITNLKTGGIVSNNLFPVFLKIENLKGLIVGGGRVACEKLYFMLKNSPQVNITLVAEKISTEVRELVQNRKANVLLIEKRYDKEDLKDIRFILAATNNYQVNEQIASDAREKGILINVADTPGLCDFYLSSVITRGDLKIAVSTNGKSPTFAKRVREFLEEILPEETHTLVNNLHKIRNKMGGQFTEKVKKLNELTSELLR
jgi:siroheme synthase-like protein